MNPFAYRTTGLALKALSRLSKARISLHGEEKVPQGSIIFVINHFTRIETLLLPYYLNKTFKMPIWSLADYQLFVGALGNFLEKVGAVSTKDPKRDRLIVKSLLTGEAAWIIYPEGRMVKNKKIIENGRYMISYAGGKHPPHTGAATLGLRTEFYRQRIRFLSGVDDKEVARLLNLFEIESMEPILNTRTYLVPVNVTYYPIRARENLLSQLATRFMGDLSERAMEEIMTEGTMMISGVDVDIRFGDPIAVEDYIRNSRIEKDITSRDKIDFDDPIRSKKMMRREALKIMRRYMHDIYSLTTVNHDHLFASTLRSMPSKTIDVLNFRRRVFLTSQDHVMKTHIHLHNSLTTDQTHLLTDDRFDKFSNFISIAVEKGVLKMHGDDFTKDKKKFSSAFDFHSIRIENPIAVMANAVEPLEKLQNRIRLFSFLPDCILRRMICSLLLKTDMDEFEIDYQSYYRENETKEKQVGKPYLVKGRSKDIGVVLVHGYMAAPLEVRELAEYLGRRGIWVYAVRLKGHGTSPEDLSGRTFKEWMMSVDRGFAIVSNLCKKVVAGGFSTGAGLALDLAARINGLEGVFAVCPPLKLQNISSKLASAVDTWNKLMTRVGTNGVAKEFVVNNPENPHINYHRNPVAGVRELERLMDAVEPKLPEIKIPALVIQGDGDPVVDPKGSKKVFDQLGSREKQYTLLNFSRHGILLGEGAERVHKEIYRYVRELSVR
jgi:esterase/lipase/1-acyl-sn-glycerol-3-phosphate acyltransferase